MSEPKRASAGRGRAAVMVIASQLVLLAALLLLPTATQANWLSKFTGAAEHTASRGSKLGSTAIDNAARHVRSLTVDADGVAALAAQATQEGHWRFVNRAGETLTAGTPDEMKRVASVLLPETKEGVKLALYVTEDTLFVHRAALKDLPKGVELNLVVGRESYRVVRRGDGTAERLFAQVRGNLLVELTDRKRFEEAVWQLVRPLEAAGVRVLALEPGGPPRLAAAPRIDPATKRPLVDAIDPASLPAALGSVRGQTVLVIGRVDGRLLYFQPSTGAERSVLLPDLFKAAEDADVNLVVLRAGSTPRQPGGRNWLWQKVEVHGLDQAMRHARMADFLDALGNGNSRLLVSANPSGRRTAIEIRPAAELSGSLPSPVGDLFTGVVSEVTGRIVTAGVEASMRSAERQQELDQRLVPGVPSGLQLGYLALVLLGLFGVPISRAWWRRLWPPEAAGEYAGRTGYWAARLVRGGAFLLLFLPVTAPVTAPLNLARQVWDAVTAPVRWWRWLAGRRAASTAS